MSAEHWSDLELDRLRIEGRSDPARARHLEGCAICQARQKGLLDAEDAFRARYAEGALIGELQQRLEARRPRRGSWIPALAALAAAAAAVAIAVVISPGIAPDAIRSKGDDELLAIFVLRPDGGRSPLSGPIAPGSRLAVRLAPKQRSAVRLLWSSPPKGWEALYPEERAASWMLAEPAWLEREVVLDEAREDEELAVVACRESVDHRAAAAMLDGKARSDCAIARARIEKR